MDGLVVSRYPGERVRVGPLPDGQHVWIEVDRVEGSHVRLRIVAPQTLQIWREELVEEDQR